MMLKKTPQIRKLFEIKKKQIMYNDFWNLCVTYDGTLFYEKTACSYRRNLRKF